MKSIHHRWLKAQEYEKNWWNVRADSLNLSYLKAFAEEILKEHTDVFSITQETSILEVGSGPAGVLTFLNTNERYAIDPLEDFFSSIDSYKAVRNPQVHYYKGRAEELPFPDNKFDLIILDNVLDHCEDINLSVKEMSRVLKKEGSIYVRLNIYSRWGKIMRAIAELVELDKGHPHTFTRFDIEKIFLNHGMRQCKVLYRPFFIVLKKHLKSNFIKGFLKIITFSVPQSIVWIFQKDRN